MTEPTTPISPGKWWGLRRLADDAGRFTMLAVDQRPPIKNLVAAARGTEHATFDDVEKASAEILELARTHGLTPSITLLFEEDDAS